MKQPLWWHVVRVASVGLVLACYAMIVFVLVVLPLVALHVAGMWQLEAVFVACVVGVLGRIGHAAVKEWRRG